MPQLHESMFYYHCLRFVSGSRALLEFVCITAMNVRHNLGRQIHCLPHLVFKKKNISTAFRLLYITITLVVQTPLVHHTFFLSFVPYHEAFLPRFYHMRSRCCSCQIHRPQCRWEIVPEGFGRRLLLLTPAR